MNPFRAPLRVLRRGARRLDRGPATRGVLAERMRGPRGRPERLGGAMVSNGARACGRRRWGAAAVRQGWWRAAVRVVAVLLLAVWPVMGVGASAGAADGAGNGLVKVYVVRTPAQNGGTPDSLASVAARTGVPGGGAEVFDLNRGRLQPDGSALTDPAQPLHPGWILRLPADAQGPDVQLARETGTTGGTAQGGAGQGGGDQSGAAQDSARQPSGVVTIPLAAGLAMAGSLLLALVTAAIVARRQAGRAARAVGRAVRSLGEPLRRARRVRQRRGIAEAFGTDHQSVREAYGAVAELAVHPGRDVHAVGVGSTGITAWVTTTQSAPAPWQELGGARWRRPTGTERGLGGAPVPDELCLVRVGVDDEGQPVFVDLSRLDGVLSVTGDPRVARDVVQALLAEIARSRPAVPVTVLQGGAGPSVVLPNGMARIDHVEIPAATAAADPGQGTLRAAARRRPLKAVVVVAGTPSEQEAAQLHALCGPDGAGWTALVCGETGGAHWRWRADAEGLVDIPLLGVTLSVPA